MGQKTGRHIITSRHNKSYQGALTRKHNAVIENREESLTSELKLNDRGKITTAYLAQ